MKSEPKYKAKIDASLIQHNIDCDSGVLYSIKKKKCHMISV